MAFAITKYIFPIGKEIELSHSMGFRLDNPRNENEVNIIKGFIGDTLAKNNEDKDDFLAPQSLRLGFSLGELKEFLRQTHNDDYALEYLTDNQKKPYVDLLAETWIILRFPDDEIFNQISENKNEFFRNLFLEESTTYTETFKISANYCHLVSLLSNNDSDYHGESFLLSENPYEIFINSENKKVYESLEAFINYNFSLKHADRTTNWLYWMDGIDSLIDSANKIESLVTQDAGIERGKKLRLSQKQTPKQKLMHIGGILKTSYEHLRDPELMLLLLVSIIEYLVTRNPDTNKFNVEDSISRQFKLKCAILVHNQDKDYSLVTLNDQLNDIYSKRSDLAHGNYREDFKIDDIVAAVYLLYNFNKYILSEFIADRDLIEYLKDN